MNPGTGHLVRDLYMVPADLRGGYEPVPPELQRAVARKLAGKSEATVSLTSGGKLSRWAAEKRKKRKKTAKESRRKNRKR